MSQQKAIKNWKKDKKGVAKGVKSIASYKGNLPIDLHNKSIKIEKSLKGYICDLKLLNKAGIQKYGFENATVQVAIKVKDSSTKTIMQRLTANDYKLGGSQIVQRNKKWFLLLTYSFEKTNDNEYSKENILGVDMGIVYPVYLAVNNSLAREKIEGGEIEHFRSKVEKRRISLLRQGKYAGNGRIGHGRATRISPIENLSEKVSNFRKTTNYKYANFVVEFAKRNNCGVIQLEDLSGISENNSFLKKWPFYDLQLKIIGSAKLCGIEVRKINRAYTSQRCSCCGFIDESNRPKNTLGQAHFKCQNCEFETNADYNAAKNISLEGIEVIINKQLESQRRAVAHRLKYE